MATREGFWSWGNKGSAADLDKNGTVDVDGLMLVIVNWTEN